MTTKYINIGGDKNFLFGNSLEVLNINPKNDGERKMEKITRIFGILAVCFIVFVFFTTNSVADENSPPPGGTVVYGDTNPPPPPPADNGNGTEPPPPAHEPSIAESFVTYTHGDNMTGGDAIAFSKASYLTGENVMGTADAISDVSGNTETSEDQKSKNAWSRAESSTFAERNGQTEIAVYGNVYQSTWAEISIDDKSFGAAGNLSNVNYSLVESGGEGAPANLSGHSLAFGWTSVSKESDENSRRITTETYSEGTPDAMGAKVDLSGGSLAQTYMENGESYTLGQGKNSYNYSYSDPEMSQVHFATGHTESYSNLTQGENGIYARSKVSSTTQSGVKPPDPSPAD
ncbi:MAG: hypothetical protein ABH830_05195 [Patescibacteria group bacterium]